MQNGSERNRNICQFNIDLRCILTHVRKRWLTFFFQNFNTMDTIAFVVTLIFSETLTCTYGHLRLQKVCETGDPTGTNHTLVHAFSYTDWARACDVNTYCNYVSFHDDVCAMYNDVSVCTAGGGPTRDVYKVCHWCDISQYPRFSANLFLTPV